jgi:hypothetical protein
MVSPGFLSPQDRGFLFGDGLFETILVRDGRAPLLRLTGAREVALTLDALHGQKLNGKGQLPLPVEDLWQPF